MNKISQKIKTIFAIKGDLKNALVLKGAQINDQTPFSDYSVLLNNLSISSGYMEKKNPGTIISDTSTHLDFNVDNKFKIKLNNETIDPVLDNWEDGAEGRIIIYGGTNVNWPADWLWSNNVPIELSGEVSSKFAIVDLTAVDDNIVARTIFNESSGIEDEDLSQVEFTLFNIGNRLLEIQNDINNDSVDVDEEALNNELKILQLRIDNLTIRASQLDLTDVEESIAALQESINNLKEQLN